MQLRQVVCDQACMLVHRAFMQTWHKVPCMSHELCTHSSIHFGCQVDTISMTRFVGQRPRWQPHAHLLQQVDLLQWHAGLWLCGQVRCSMLMVRVRRWQLGVHYGSRIAAQNKGSDSPSRPANKHLDCTCVCAPTCLARSVLSVDWCGVQTRGTGCRTCCPRCDA